MIDRLTYRARSQWKQAHGSEQANDSLAQIGRLSTASSNWPRCPLCY